MKKQIIFLALLLIASISSQRAKAEVKLPAILSSNMVLQQDTEVTIWGWAKAKEKIHIKSSWNKKKIKTKADKDGKWSVALKTPKAGGNHSMTIEGKNKIELENILIGDIWVCSGQSNMYRKLGLQRGQKPIINFWEASQQAKHPEIRFFKVKRNLATMPQKDVEGEWVVCTPETVLEFSAVGYFFGKKLHQQLAIPIGLIQTAWGGTPVEGWTRKAALGNDFMIEKEQNEQARFEVDSLAYAKNMEAFQKGFIKERPTEPPSFYVKRRKHYRIGHLYNAMIHPLTNYAIKGAIWYQGESNRGFPEQYKQLFPNMIQTWRKDWRIGDFPFYFVQIAPYYYNGTYEIPYIWEAQYEALNLPQTGMASTHDIGQIYDIHPPEKEEVGRRLALVALNQTYGKSEVAYSGPVVKNIAYNGNQVVLEFDPMGGELFSAGNGIGGISPFYIADEFQVFHPAKVEQKENTLTLTANGVEKPIAVRYLWNDNANATIFNSYGLPAIGFRTDDWVDARYEE